MGCCYGKKGDSILRALNRKLFADTIQGKMYPLQMCSWRKYWRGLCNLQKSSVGSCTQKTHHLLHQYTRYLSCVWTKINKCTSKVVTPDNKQTMAKNTASWSETAKELDKDDNLKLKLSLSYKTSDTPGANKLNISSPGAKKLNLSNSWSN